MSLLGGIGLTEHGATILHIIEAISLLFLGFAAIAASRLLRAPVRSALRRRAGRVAVWLIAGAALAWVDAGARLAMGFAPGGEAWTPGAAVRLAAAVVATIAAHRVVPRLAAVARYAYYGFREERAAATRPGTIVPIQATAVLSAVGSFAVWMQDGGTLLAGACVAFVGALWTLQRRRHAAARADGWTRPKPLRLRLRTGTVRALEAIRSN